MQSIYHLLFTNLNSIITDRLKVHNLYILSCPGAAPDGGSVLLERRACSKVTHHDRVLLNPPNAVRSDRSAEVVVVLFVKDQAKSWPGLALMVIKARSVYPTLVGSACCLAVR